MQTNPAPPPAPLPNKPGDNNPYDFIMNDNNAPKRGMFSWLNNSSKNARLAIFVGGLVALLIIIIMFVSLLSSAGKSQTESLISLAQEQAEIVRVANIGVEKANSQDTKNLASTALSNMESAEFQTVSLLASNGHKLDTKKLALKQSSETDSQLEEATNNNSFDETFTKIVETQLKAYRLHVQSLYGTSKNDIEKSILSSQFSSVSIFLSSGTASS